ncbi:N-glycosylase/DNA lyase [Candidatus Micrarchaeota archaeon]|nr:N-glycosylase/DNA lyase [Candidatus Micrarchaeota archaeon]
MGMDTLAKDIFRLRNGETGQIVQNRMDEFRAKGAEDENQIFKELCFCLLTANFTSERGIKIQNAIDDGFIYLAQEELTAELIRLGHRYPNARSKYILAAREHKPKLKEMLELSSKNKNQKDVRHLFAETVLGFGYKEASHFLRNIGYDDLAIIDFHVVDVLVRHRIIRKPKQKSLSRNLYLKIETALAKLAKCCEISQGELDLYLWYMETGKILK